MRRTTRLFTATLAITGFAIGCGSSTSSTSGTDGGSSSGSTTSSGGAKSTSSRGTGPGSSGASGSGVTTGNRSSGASSGSSGSQSAAGDAGSSSGSSGSSGADAGHDATAPADAGAHPSGWLYTSGSKIYVSNGTTGTQWMGRGVNVDDIFFCGYDNTLWMTNPGQTLETMISGVITGWKPTFLRISLSMDSNATVVSWLSNAAQYKTPMTTVIDSIGAHAGVYVLVTLRSDASMIAQDTADGDPEATGLPSESTTTPSASKYPTGTDATYQALVDSFASSSFVLFGLTNEPGGDKDSNAQISAAMSHAVGVIRAEEDKLGVPHHIVSVQGNNWTSNIGFYATTPLPYDNVVYEVHGYPPTPASYTYANIPVIIGEYGSLASSAAFYADVETKQIPNLAWDFDSYNDCAPDLATVNQSDTNLVPTAWGTTVQAYLLAH